jgi:hypothetical protein
VTKAVQEGHRDAHTRADPAPIEADLALPGEDPADLLAGSPDVAASDMLSLAAELAAAPRRARGRPAGSGNRKNNDMIGYLAALGHRDPWVTLSMIQTADTAKLALALRSPVMKNGKQLVSKSGTPLFNTPSPMDVLAIQKSAADALMPYHHAKKPQQLELPPGDLRPLMVIGEMNVSIGGPDGFMSAGVAPPEKANEIKGDAVRIPASDPHETAKPLKDNDDSA